MKKSLSLPKLYKKADKAISQFVRQRDGGKCCTCGKTDDWKKMDAGHFHPRSCWQLRWDERNVNTQCFRCNRMLSGNLGLYATYLIRKYGADVLFDLEEIYKKSKAKVVKPTREYLESIIKLYGN